VRCGVLVSFILFLLFIVSYRYFLCVISINPQGATLNKWRKQNMILTKEELKKSGWKSNAERSKALKRLSKKMASYIVNTSPAFKINK